MMVRAMLAIAIGVTIAGPQAPPQTPPKTPPATPQASPAPPPKPESPRLEVSWKFQFPSVEPPAEPAVESDKDDKSDKEVPWLTPGASRVFVSTRRAGTTAHDVSDGKVLWTNNEACEAAPAAAGNILVLVGAESLRVLEQEGGREVFRAEFTGKPVQAFGSADRIGVALEGGLQTWDHSGAKPWKAELKGKPVTPVVSSGDLFIVGTDEPALAAFDATTGASRWSITLPTRPLSLVGTADRVYFGGQDRWLYSFRTVSEPKKWDWRTSRVRTIGQPLVDGKSVYFALLDNSVRAFNVNGGSERWDQVVEARPLTGPMKMAEWLAVPLSNGRVALLPPNHKTGELPPPTSATATGSVRLVTAAMAPDGSRVYTITVANDTTRVLSAWTLKIPEVKR